MTEDQNTGFIIRPALQMEEAVLADLHFRAYYNRFFDPATRDRNGKLYGAPLAQDFPELAAGQNADYFRSYWQGFMRGISNPDPISRNYCFVAAENGVPVAFVKGSGKPLSGQLRALFNEACLGADKLGADKCCELSSVYCDPERKWRGAGRKLVEEFARCMQGLGYEAMVACAYEKNDSPAFFEKLGGVRAGLCRIANDYLTPDGQVGTVDIPGVWLLWDGRAMRGLINPAHP